MQENLLYILGVAFLGGLILNVMPCVLPVLTLKVFHLVEHSENDAATNKMHGIAYTAGVLVAFAIFAAVVIGLRSGGENLGWGMQFQNAGFLAVITAVIFAFALNALGVFELTIGMGGGGASDGYWGSFTTGIFATVMSTPCSAPFLGFAAAAALGSQVPGWQTVVIFLMIGLGLAFPFLVIAFVPASRKLLPKPGAWMDTFKSIMGFTLMGAAAWLLSILLNKLSKDASQNYLYFLVLLALALWGMERFGGLIHGLARRLTVRGIGLVAIVAGAILLVDLTPRPKTAVAASSISAEKGGPLPPVVKDGKIVWTAYDKKTIQAAHAKQRPVFADFTADWCLSCKANEKAVIETDAIRSTLEKTKVLPMKADMTDDDEVLEAEMERLGRAGIPIYVIYYPDGTHKLLPEVITIAMLKEALEGAAQKYPPEKFAQL